MKAIPEQYFAGALSDEEKRQLFSEMDKDEALREAFFAQHHLLTLVRQRATSDPDETIKHYAQFKKVVVKHKMRTLALQTLKYAAIVALAIWLWTVWQNPKTERQTQALLTLIEAPSGHRTHVVLPDGTDVWLNARTKLTYPANFSFENRHIRLEGEAYFEVASDINHPFTVSTELLSINVTGTEFNVNAYPDETVSVTLIQGKVTVITPDSLLTLHPNEQATVTQSKAITLNTNAGTPDVYAWTNGEFYYLNKPLRDIIKDLERRFNVNITISNEMLAHELFTYHADENITLDEILRHLKKTETMNYSKTGNQILIY